MTSLYFLIILILGGSEGLELLVNGEISFALQEGSQNDGERVVLKLKSRDGVNRAAERGHTVGPIVECQYQYPQEAQVNALLSNMMNELTKVFIRGADYMRQADTKGLLSDLENAIASQELKSDTIAKVLQDIKNTNITDNDTKPFRRKLGRFRVVHSRGDGFFEEVFANMTRDYRTLHNDTLGTIYRTEEDPCTHQEEIKKIWKELLTRSREGFLQAANQCMQMYLASRHDAGTRIVEKLKNFLEREHEKIKIIQLKTLCNEFQLCYDELL